MDTIIPIFMICILPVLWTAGVFAVGYVAGSRRVRFRSPWYSGGEGQAVAGSNGYHQYYDALDREEV